MTNQNKSLLILSAVAIGILSVYAYRVIPGYVKISRPATVAPAPQKYEPRAAASDPVRGNRNGSITIFEFGDVECPYCGQIDPQVKDLLAQRPGARLVWKDCPLPNHPNAERAAAAALCAGDQGRYWEFHDELIKNNDRLNDNTYQDIAAALKLDGNQFSACLASGEKLDQIKKSFGECNAAGVTELPWFSINGKTFSGSGVIYDLTSQLNSK